MKMKWMVGIMAMIASAEVVVHEQTDPLDGTRTAALGMLGDKPYGGAGELPILTVVCRARKRCRSQAHDSSGSLGLVPAVRAKIEARRSRLAAAETGDARGRQAIQEAFVAGYRAVLWVGVGLALASSLSAAALIRTERRLEHR